MDYLWSVTWDEHEFRISPEFKSVHFIHLDTQESHPANSLEKPVGTTLLIGEPSS